MCIAGSQNAAVHRQQMRCESDLDFFAADCPQRLLNFRCVAMPANLISMHSFIQFRVMCILCGFAPRTGHTGFAVGNDAVFFNQACLERGHQRQRNRCGIAAGIGNQLFAAYFVTEKFRQAVNGFFVQFRINSLNPIPLLIFFQTLQAKIRAEVNKDLVRIMAFLGDFL